MTNHEPVLKRIHDAYDIYKKYPFNDHSEMGNAKISDRPDGYRVTVFPKGDEPTYDGLAIDVITPNGIFSEAMPEAAKTSRSTTGIQGKFHEELILPGEDGFQLIEELHEELRAYKNPLKEAVTLSGVVLNPQGFTFHNKDLFKFTDKKQGKVTHVNKTLMTVTGDSGVTYEFDLDATQEVPIGRAPSEKVSFQGGAIILNRHFEYLTPMALDAFSNIQNSLKNLYR